MKLLLAIALLLSSCASNPEKEKPDKPEPPKQTVVGRIASVSKVGKFVLIQKYGHGLLPQSQIYQSRGPNNRSASLRPSGERVRDFFAADLLSGTVEKGDAVITYSTTPEEPDEEAEESPESPNENEPSNNEDPDPELTPNP